MKSLTAVMVCVVCVFAGCGEGNPYADYAQSEWDKAPRSQQREMCDLVQANPEYIVPAAYEAMEGNDEKADAFVAVIKRECP